MTAATYFIEYLCSIPSLQLTQRLDYGGNLNYHITNRSEAATDYASAFLNFSVSFELTSFNILKLIAYRTTGKADYVFGIP